MRFLASLLVLLAALAPSSLQAADGLAGVRRIVFLGDSNTYAGEYVDGFELSLRRDYPGRLFDVLDLGLPSETVSGLSEPGHADGKFPRPDLHERLERILAKTKPDLVIACYGMNDGIYFPPDEQRLEAFRQGMKRLHAKVEAAGARIIHLTPPIFDAQPLGTKVSNDGVGLPYAGYDEVLAQFSAWLLEQRAAGWQVIDLHGPMRESLQDHRRTEPGFAFAKDGVHGDSRAHALMAKVLLEGMGLPPALENPSKALSQRRKILADAWLTECGHLRPGMAKGLPISEAEAKAAELEAEIERELGR